MSIAVAPVGVQPLASHGGAISGMGTKPPRRRQVVAKTDTITDPETR